VSSHFFEGKGASSPRTDFFAASARVASFPSLIGHKILCPMANKIMPVDRTCQGLVGKKYRAFILEKTVSYRIFAKIWIKNTSKKMTLL
jgi:hypothetical protein